MARTQAKKIAIYENGVLLTSDFDRLNFTGAGHTGSVSGSSPVTVTEDFPSGGGSGIGPWSTPAEAVAADGSVLVFTVGGSAPTDVVSDGILLYANKGYTYSGTQITLTNGPTQYIRYR